MKKHSLVVVLISLFLSSCNYIEGDTYHFTMHWPDQFNMTYRTTGKMHLDSGANRTDFNFETKYRFNVAKNKKNNYIAEFLGAKQLVNETSTTLPDTEVLKLMGHISGSCNLIISNKGELLGWDNIEKCDEQMVNEINSHKGKYSDSTISEVTKIMTSKKFSIEYLASEKDFWLDLVGFWVGRSMTVGHKYQGSMHGFGAEFTFKKDQQFHTEYSIVKVDKINNRQIVTIRWKSTVSQDELQKFVKTHDKFKNKKLGKKKLKYEMIRIIKTDAKTLLPLEYMESEEIILPQHDSFSLIKYEFEYSKNSSGATADLPLGLKSSE